MSDAATGTIPTGREPEHWAKVYVDKDDRVCATPDAPRYGHHYRKCSSEFEARMLAAGCGGQYGVIAVPMKSLLGIDHMFSVVTDYG